MSYLVLVRHGQSQWNEKGLWTGWTDIPLNETGINEAKRTGELLADIKFDAAFTSDLTRAQQTLNTILTTISQTNIPIEKSPALKEKSYGIYTGKNKWEIKEKYGEEEFQKIRRSWDYVPPEGESLKMVYERVVPYFEEKILPLLKEGKNIIVAAHGNSLRALVKYLENISDEQIPLVEIGTGEGYVYQLDENGKVVSKEIRGENPNKLKV